MTDFVVLWKARRIFFAKLRFVADEHGGRTTMQGSDRVCLAIIAVGAICSGIAACAESEQASAVITADLAPTQSKPETSEGEPESVDEQLIFAKEELASRLGDDAGKIELVSVRHVQWRSGAIGCPAHGMAYTMAIVPGVQILLRADGEVHRYHARDKQMPFYCPADRAEAAEFGQGEEAM